MRLLKINDSVTPKDHLCHEKPNPEVCDARDEATCTNAGNQKIKVERIEKTKF